MRRSNLCLCAVLALWLLICPAGAEETRLFLLNTNDLHGHLEADNESGGFVRLATIIRSIKAAFPAEVVLLDGGDMALGTPISGLFHGKPMAQAMKTLGYDAVALGNHEFDWGQEAMAEFLGGVGAPALCANLVEIGSSRHPYRPWTVVEKNGVRLGILGLVTPDTPSRAPKASTEGWRFLQPEEAARQAIAEMPEVDAVIALTHLGVEADQRLAQAVPQIDLIVGGHSHTALQEAVYRNSTPIVQSGCYAHNVGFLELLVDTEADQLKVVSYRLLPNLDSVGNDPEILAIAEKYAVELRPILERVATDVSSVISKAPGQGNVDTPLANLIADAFRAQTQADVALYNRGGVRSDMASGPLSVGDIHKLFPFDDPVVVLKMSGAALGSVIEQGAKVQAKLSPSGMTAILDSNGQASITIAGGPLEPKRLYSVATTHFLATGGDGMSTLTQHKIERELPFTRDLFIEYLQSHPVIEAPESGRVKEDRIAPRRPGG